MPGTPFSIIHGRALVSFEYVSLLVYKLFIFITLATINTLQCFALSCYGDRAVLLVTALEKNIYAVTLTATVIPLSWAIVDFLRFLLDCIVILGAMGALCDGWLWRNEPPAVFLDRRGAQICILTAGYPYLIRMYIFYLFFTRFILIFDGTEAISVDDDDARLVLSLPIILCSPKTRSRRPPTQLTCVSGPSAGPPSGPPRSRRAWGAKHVGRAGQYQLSRADGLDLPTFDRS